MKAMRPFRAGLLPQLVAALAIGIALRWVVGLHPAWWLVWVAPAPLLYLAYRVGPRRARWLTALTAGIGISANAPYYFQVMKQPAIVVGVLLAQTMAWVFVVGATRRLVLRYQAGWTVLVYPTLWVALDTLLAALLPDGNWGSLGYTQAACLPMLQVTALLGVGGLLFLVALVPAALALAAAYGQQLRRPWGAYGTVAGLLVAALAYGTIRLRAGPGGPVTTFGLVAIDDAIGPQATASYRAAIWQQYERHVAALAAQGAQVLVLPEKIGMLTAAQAGELQRQVQALAARHHVWLETGVAIDDGHQRRNLLWLVSPAGKLAETYQKQYLAPPERDYAVGHTASTHLIAGNLYGLAICKDMHFAVLGRTYGRQRVAVMLVPAWDFYADAQLATDITITRGVENGYMVVRASREGLLTVSDAYGRTLYTWPSSFMPGSTLLARVPVGPPLATLYTRIGDIFGWLCVVAGAGMLVVGRQLRRPASSSARAIPEVA